MRTLTMPIFGGVGELYGVKLMMETINLEKWSLCVQCCIKHFHLVSATNWLAVNSWKALYWAKLRSPYRVYKSLNTTDLTTLCNCCQCAWMHMYLRACTCMCAVVANAYGPCVYVLCVFVCEWEWEREGERERECVCECRFQCVCVCVCVCVCAHACICKDERTHTGRHKLTKCVWKPPPPPPPGLGGETNWCWPTFPSRLSCTISWSELPMPMKAQTWVSCSVAPSSSICSRFLFHPLPNR